MRKPTRKHDCDIYWRGSEEDAMMEMKMAGLVSQLDILIKDFEEDEEKAGIDEVGDYLCGVRDAISVVASTIRAGFPIDEVRRFIGTELARSIANEAGMEGRKKRIHRGKQAGFRKAQKEVQRFLTGEYRYEENERVKSPTIKVRLTDDSYRKWTKWQKNLGELLVRGVHERETGFLLVLNVKGNCGSAALLGCDGAPLMAKGVSPDMLEAAGHIEEEIGDLYFRHCAKSPTLVLEHEHGASEDSILITTGKHDNLPED